MAIFAIVFLVLVTVVVAVGLAMLSRFRAKGALARGLNMSLFSVRVPREFAKEGGKSAEQQQKQEKEIISVTEQMLSSMSNIRAKGAWWKKMLYGEPYIVFEIGVHHVGEEIHFYVASPNAYAELIEKQIHSFYPTAEITRATDYNIFNPQGVSAGAYMTLKKHHILPFRTYQGLPADPLGEILTAMSKLEREGEGAALQVLVRPSRKSDHRKTASKVLKELQKGASWGEALSKAGKGLGSEVLEELNRALNPAEDLSKPKTEDQRQMLPVHQELVKAIANKISKPAFDVNIRLVTSAPTEFQAEEMLRDMGSAFVQFEAPDFNSFRAVSQKGRQQDVFVRDYSFRVFNERYALYLSTEEIASFYHFPLPTTATPQVRFLKAKPSEPPPGLPEEGIILGTNTYRGQEKVIRMTREDRARHMYIIGQTGTGKSTLIKHMIRQDILAGEGVGVVDPHGELIDYVLGHIPKERADDVVLFDPSDTERPLGLNFLEIDPTKPVQKSSAIDEFFKILKTVYKDTPDAFGPLFEKFFRYSIMLLLDDYEHEVPTIADIARVFADEDYRNDKLSREKNGDVVRFWKFEAEQMSGDWSLPNMSGYITSKFAPFLLSEYVRPIVTQGKSSINFRDIMDTKKILLVKLPKGIIGELNMSLLGMIMVSRLMIASFGRAELDDAELKKAAPFYLYIDEFQNFTTDSIATILAESRKYKLVLTLVHQYIKQITDEKIRGAIFGNVGNTVALRIGAEDAAYEPLKLTFQPVFTPEDLVNLDNFNAYFKPLIRGESVRPFNIQFGFPTPGNLELAQQIRELSRMKYGRDAAEVEREYLEKQKVSDQL